MQWNWRHILVQRSSRRQLFRLDWGQVVCVFIIPSVQKALPHFRLMINIRYILYRVQLNSATTEYLISLSVRNKVYQLRVQCTHLNAYKDSLNSKIHS